MMVAKGYKQTEIGVIPEDWEVKSIGSFVKYIKGYPFKSKDYCADGIRVIRISDTTYNSITDYGGIFVSHKIAKETNKWALQKGDLIVSTVGSKPPMYDSMVGKVIYVKDKFSGSLLNQNAVMFKNQDESLQILLSSIFKTKRYVEYVESIFRGNANQASITLDELFKFIIPLPPLLEQKAIAEALSDADAWIENLEKLIAKKRLIKQGAMQDLLSPKEDWEVKKLGEMTQLITKGTTPTSVGFDFEDSGINFIKIESITKTGKILKDKLAYINKQCHEVLNRSKIFEGDILFSIAGALGRTSIVQNDVIPANTNQALAIIRLKESAIDKKFLYYFFNDNGFQNMLNTISVTGAQPNLSLQNINEFEINFPKSLSEQTRIANILSDMDNEIESLENKLAKARQIKQGMMQELLTGRVRLV